MRTTAIGLAAVLGAQLLVAACSDEKTAQEPGEYYPLSVGDHWVYEEIDDQYGSEKTFHRDVAGFQSVELDYVEGAPQEMFVVENTFPDSPNRRAVYYTHDDGTRIARYRTEIYDDQGELEKIMEYEGGFLRFDRSRVTEGEIWEEHVIRFMDTLDGSPVQEMEFLWQFEVLAESEEVTVPAGTFETVVYERGAFYGTSGESKIYYYAPAVGEVKELHEYAAVEYLVEYSVGGED